MSSCMRDGSNPEVDEANTASGAAARLAWANSLRFKSSRSGALSWTKSAPSTAASGVRTITSCPSVGSGIRVSACQARRAFASMRRTLRSASGSGS